MKRLIAIFLILTMLTGCATQTATNETAFDTVNDTTITATVDFESLSDPELLKHVKDEMYSELVMKLNSKDYFVENVDAVYISKEYIDEISYNSKSNIYFGCTLEELEQCFEDTKYAFTLGDDGKTTVKAFEKYDDSIERIIKNVATDAGVILVRVTAYYDFIKKVSAMFAISEKSGIEKALVLSDVATSIITGIITGIETKDFDQALKAAVTGSENFKWGAVVGTIAGGVSATTKYVKAMKALNGMELNGLNMQQAASIQMETKWSANTIKQVKSID